MAIQPLQPAIQDYLNKICCPPAGVPPTINYAKLAFLWTVGEAVNECPLTLTGDPTIVVTVSPSLPAGLSLDPATGCITGTPTETMTNTTFTFTATNSSGISTDNVDIVVDQASVGTPPTIVYPKAQEDMIAGNAVNICPTTLTGDATIIVTVSPSLPSGLSLNPNTGCITGTPTTTSALSSFAFTATNSAGTDTFDMDVLVQQEFPIKVQDAFNITSKSEGDILINNALVSGTIVGSSFANGLYTFETTAGAEVGDNYAFVDATLYEDSTGLITTYGDFAFTAQSSSTIILGSGLTFGSNAFLGTQNSIVTMGSFTAANDNTFGDVPNDGCTFNFTGTIGSTTGDDNIFIQTNWSSNGAVVNTIVANETSDGGNIEGDLNLLISVGATVNFTL